MRIKPINNIEIASPCTGDCKLDADICLGCHRHIDDIVSWTALNSSARQAALKSAELIALSSQLASRTSDHCC